MIAFQPALGALLLQTVLVAIAAVVAPRAKALALALGAVAFFAAPWLAGDVVLLRGLVALSGWWNLLRVVDVVRLTEPWSASRRIVHAVSMLDTRTLRRERPRLDFGVLARAIGWAALFALAFWIAHAPRLVVRWGAGLVMAYAAVEALWAFVRVGYRAAGFASASLHASPIASCSIGELWGMRWARPVSAWLRDTCFRPLARRGAPTTGLLLGFLVSAVGHAYPVLVALSPMMAAWMLAFFLEQGVLVVIEAKLGVARWRRPVRRVWTIAIMVASSPLFVEPALRVLGVAAP